MSNMFFVVCIVAIACGTAVISDYLKAKSKRESRAATQDSGTLEELRALEERVRVLERIVTERKYDLAEEIDNLK